MIQIAGAGLAGLLAAHSWPQAEVFEVQPGPRAEHRALLRFRSDAVARMIGIDFKPVTVRKGIWIDGGFVPPSIQIANHYSRKVLGSIEAERSIWNLEPVQRFIAPENLYEQLINSVGKRIHWGKACDFKRQPTVSTVPLPITMEACGLNVNKDLFRRAGIRVARYRVAQCNAYQTVYFPDPALLLYRASITGDLLIVESVTNDMPDSMASVLEAFGFRARDLTPIDTVEQKYGKIVQLDATIRRGLLTQLTTQFQIYSLGRFATWRNILLDDVVNDIAVIRKLLRASEYEQRLHFAQ